jgi:hypothetical protein
VPNDDPLKDWPDAKALLLRFQGSDGARDPAARPSGTQAPEAGGLDATRSESGRPSGSALAELGLWLFAAAAAGAACFFSG